MADGCLLVAIMQLIDLANDMVPNRRQIFAKSRVLLY